MNLKDKVIVITGGARGLGRALAEICVQKDAHVIVCDVGDIKQEGVFAKVLTHQTDVTKETDVQNVAQDAFMKFGKIDVWINNAGIWLPKEDIEHIDIEKAKRLFQVNVLGTMYGMRSALKFMKPLNAGVIMNIISTTAFDGMNGSSGSMYVASKYALRGLTNTVRDELKSAGISVVGVYPGGIKTDIFSEQPPKNIDEFMSAEEVATKIIENLELESPELELILKRPGQVNVVSGAHLK